MPSDRQEPDEPRPLTIPELRTQRLILRRWRDADREPFADMNGDPEVMRHFRSTLSRAESDALVDRIEAAFAQHGFGLWAVEAPGVADFVGFVGLAVPNFQAHFTPAVEIGWRLRRSSWGRGYAIEGARAAASFAFGTLGLEEIVSFTVPGNLASRRVMERLGMTNRPGDEFDHPRLPEGYPLRRHVLYRLRRDAYLQRAREPMSELPASTA